MCMLACTKAGSIRSMSVMISEGGFTTTFRYCYWYITTESTTGETHCVCRTPKRHSAAHEHTVRTLPHALLT